MKFVFVLVPALILGLLFGRQERKTDSAALSRSMIFCAPGFDPALAKGHAPLLKGLGKVGYRITTRSDTARKYFNQGLALTYAFNHGEAARSFNTALRYDSTCAMAYWGLAMVLGPNYNAALNPTSLGEINEAVEKAVRYSGVVQPEERALIDALALRFPKKEVKDMTPFYEDYAAAMRKAHAQFPDDMDIAVLLADALMNLHPWNLWLKDGTAQPWTPEIISLLEKILARDPDHPAAIHYYIHATEASREAIKARPYADKLRDAMPSAGHLVHMPSHTYIRTGDYHKGVVANEKASLADSTYIAQCRVQGFYPLLLYPHNIHFLAACAFLEGNSGKAIDAAWMVSRKSDKKYILENVTVQHYYSIPYYVLVQLGRWQELLQLPKPDERMLYPVAIWHYARGMSFAARGEAAKANHELEELKKIGAGETLKSQLIWDMNSARDLVNIASLTLEGELLARGKNYAPAITLLKKAVALEDGLNYNEPPDWFFSVRHTLGHWLVQSGNFAEAEQVYRQDLSTFPENGWALKGLENSLIGQKKWKEAEAVARRFEKAWQWSDVPITTSRIL